jgi:hypothetical protein
MIKQNNIKFYIILLLFILNYYIFDNISLNENLPESEIIIKLIEKYLDPQNIPVLNEQEKIIAEYWKKILNLKCPFSKLTSHGLSNEEALLLIDFFNINDIEDLKKLEEFIKK